MRRIFERIYRSADREIQSGLSQIAIPRAHPVCAAPGQRRSDDQPVELIILIIAIEHGGKRIFDLRRALDHTISFDPGGQGDEEIMDEAKPPFIERGGYLFEHAKAEVFEHRHRIRQDDGAFALIKLKP